MWFTKNHIFYSCFFYLQLPQSGIMLLFLITTPSLQLRVFHSVSRTYEIWDQMSVVLLQLIGGSWSYSFLVYLDGFSKLVLWWCGGLIKYQIKNIIVALQIASCKQAIKQSGCFTNTTKHKTQSSKICINSSWSLRCDRSKRMTSISHLKSTSIINRLPTF